MDDKIAEVCGITGCTEDKARFFLESTNGDVAMAVNAFFGTSPRPPRTALARHRLTALDRLTTESRDTKGWKKENKLKKGHRPHPCCRLLVFFFGFFFLPFLQWSSHCGHDHDD